MTKSVQEFDYINSEFKNPKTVYKLENISPDGMSIDNEDRLWIAQYGGGKIVCIDTKTFDTIYEYNFNPINFQIWTTLDGLTPIYVEGLEFLIELCLMHNDRRVTV